MEAEKWESEREAEESSWEDQVIRDVKYAAIVGLRKKSKQRDHRF